MKKVSDKKRFFCGFIAVAPPFSGEKADIMIGDDFLLTLSE
jgi:hypothetical protein